MSLLFLLESNGSAANDPAASALRAELPLWLDQSLHVIADEVVGWQSEAVVLATVDLISRWVLRRLETNAGVPGATIDGLMKLKKRLSRRGDSPSRTAPRDTPRDQWKGFLPVAQLQDLASYGTRIREPTVGDLVRRILSVLAQVQQRSGSLPASLSSRAALDSASPMSLPTQEVASSLPEEAASLAVGRPSLQPQAGDLLADEEDEVVVFTGRSAAGRGPPTSGSPAPAQNRLISSPIAQVMTVGAAGSPTLSGLALASDRMSPKPGVIGGERRPPSVTRSPSVQGLEGPSTPKSAVAVAKGAGFSGSDLPMNPWARSSAQSPALSEPRGSMELDEAKRKELLLRDLISPLKGTGIGDGASVTVNAGRPMSPFSSLPGPADHAAITAVAPQSDAMDIPRDDEADLAGISVALDEDVGRDVMHFLGLDASPREPRSGALLMEKAIRQQREPGSEGPSQIARHPPPGLGGMATSQPSVATSQVPFNEPPALPNFADANSAALLAFFRLQQQEAAQMQVEEQLRRQQERLAGSSAASDFTSPFAAAMAMQGLASIGLQPAAGGMPIAFAPAVSGLGAVPTNAGQAGFPFGLHPLQLQLLIQSGWQPPASN
ncbi:hypothetical protein DFJ74DRAFT_125412 [Hyaloraphidium curvatum]|nr:hypothetical protein DFJ74DRAFT_125412 [Hyaloraphidium curvatum]